MNSRIASLILVSLTATGVARAEDAHDSDGGAKATVDAMNDILVTGKLICTPDSNVPGLARKIPFFGKFWQNERKEDDNSHWTDGDESLQHFEIDPSNKTLMVKTGGVYLPTTEDSHNSVKIESAVDYDNNRTTESKKGKVRVWKRLWNKFVSKKSAESTETWNWDKMQPTPQPELDAYLNSVNYTGPRVKATYGKAKFTATRVQKRKQEKPEITGIIEIEKHDGARMRTATFHVSCKDAPQGFDLRPAPVQQK